jgi:ORF6N domain
MPQNTQKIAIAEEAVISKIYLIRGQKVMLDRDLAELYGVETKTLKQAVRRNLSRFPLDFMFEMTGEELDNWRSQFVTSKQDRQGLRDAPFCFTEQGATMLSCLLNSERAISVNILIIRVFTKLREMVLAHKDILIKLEQIEKAMLLQDSTMNRHEAEKRRPSQVTERSEGYERGGARDDAPTKF